MEVDDCGQASKMGVDEIGGVSSKEKLRYDPFGFQRGLLTLSRNLITKNHNDVERIPAFDAYIWNLLLLTSNKENRNVLHTDTYVYTGLGSVNVSLHTWYLRINEQDFGTRDRR
jgi:hypothetical protein